MNCFWCESLEPTPCSTSTIDSRNMQKVEEIPPNSQKNSPKRALSIKSLDYRTRSAAPRKGDQIDLPPKTSFATEGKLLPRKINVVTGTLLALILLLISRRIILDALVFGLFTAIICLSFDIVRRFGQRSESVKINSRSDTTITLNSLACLGLVFLIILSSMAGAPTNDGLVVVLATPQIPSQWEKCDINRCKNNGLCFQDGTAEFCVCSEGYGGKQCERLIDAIQFLDSTIQPATLLIITKFALGFLFLAIIAACIGWICCCLKHFNARRLYLNNLRLARENSELREQNRRHTARGHRVADGLKRTMYLYQQRQQGRLDSIDDPKNDPAATASDIFQEIKRLYVEANSNLPDLNHTAIIRRNDNGSKDKQSVVLIEHGPEIEELDLEERKETDQFLENVTVPEESIKDGPKAPPRHPHLMRTPAINKLGE
ncbi:hypothetical protein DdX_13122 [Ditylenchus destructor]|uniref:EGF-like domain-containing protein n=1 Tax=Ditylenchus destructor TaxID=166010 RepID=A0AAD4R344_9BILA|nr:hypothetical protein DdX_13122 [Ditylenchus destructor]